MQAPTGLTGVQALPKSVHCSGVFFPRRISPQMHPLGSFDGGVFNVNSFSASNPEYSFLSFRPLMGIIPSPRQRSSPDSKTWSMILLCNGVALLRNDPVILDLHGRPVPDDLFYKHQDGLHHVCRLETRNNNAEAMLCRKIVINGRTCNCTYMSRCNKPVEFHPVVHKGLHHGRHDLVGTQYKEIADPCPCLR